jgi:poly(3-hydroxybutyrate) depolymerase
VTLAVGDGTEEGTQVKKSEIAYWASDEFQTRFDSAGGAFILAARSREEKGKFWDNDMLEPLRAAIDDFIAKNKANVDTTRIYIGGYSMGGKMTLKMSVAYPEMFAAAFPICPAWSVPSEYAELLSDLPLWITSSRRDPLVNYYLAVTPTWNRLMSASNVSEDCRFSTMGRVCKEDGTNTSSNHHAWFAINHDLFNSENGDYPNMSTVNGIGEEVKLTYPDGMISWLSMQTSDYNGDAGVGTGKLDITTATGRMIAADNISDFFKLLWNAIVDVFSF